MKIGIPEAGMMATDKEIDDAKTEVEKWLLTASWSQMSVQNL